MKISKSMIMCCLFVCIGITSEIVFTSWYSVVVSLQSNKPINWDLMGNSYFWMIFIYASIPFLIRLFKPLVGKKPFYFRVIITLLIIYIIEFLSGLFLKVTIGKCPWEYTEGWHIMGLVRVDYIPFWLVFAGLILGLYELLDNRITE